MANSEKKNCEICKGWAYDEYLFIEEIGHFPNCPVLLTKFRPKITLSLGDKEPFHYHPCRMSNDIAHSSQIPCYGQSLLACENTVRVQEINCLMETELRDAFNEKRPPLMKPHELAQTWIQILFKRFSEK